MKFRCWIKEYKFNFLRPAKTSRNTLNHKTSFFICIQNEEGLCGMGECAPIFGLSLENEFDLRKKLKEVLDEINAGVPFTEINLQGFPSIQFALETALKDLQSCGNKLLFDSPFSTSSASIKINGLIWMGDQEFQKKQVIEKIDEGFRCIKIKIGSSTFEQDVSLLNFIRETYGDDIELRLDANGAFNLSEAIDKLKRLSVFNVHSIEQPIKQGHWNKMADLVSKSPIDIALDEELVGIKQDAIGSLLDTIKPNFIILKPSLLGGFKTCDKWVSEAEKRGINWWATSFLESNIGLNAIAQWVSMYNNTLHQGLGTGKIYSFNIPSPLKLVGQNLFYDSKQSWDTSEIENNGQAFI